jgi:Domain of Unknown Function (DUF1206)
MLAVPIALQGSGQDDGGTGGTQASQTGAVAKIADSSAGVLALWAIAIGLALYVLWRLVCVLLPTDNSPKAWLGRVGYLISAVSYLVVIVTAVAFARASATQPAEGGAEDSKVERFTRDMMDNTAGRWLVGAIGVVLVGTGIYFIVRGITANFRKELDHQGVGPLSFEAIVTLGRIGWIGRGLMMIVVGWFFTHAAIAFQPDEPKGIDGALRATSGSTWGAWLVGFVAVTLVVYGVFCVVSAPRQRLRAAD